MTRSRHQRILMVLGAVAAVFAVTVVASLLYLTQADLGHHRKLVERLVSRATGYDVSIGELHIDLELWGASTLEARDITLTNPGFEPDPRLVAADHLALEIELWPLLENRIHVRDLDVTDGEVFVRGDPEHGVNWVPHHDAPRPPPSGPVRVPAIIVDRAVLTSVSTTVDFPGLPRPLVVDTERLEASTDPTDTVHFDLAGTLNGEPLAVSGTAGPLTKIVVAGETRPDLEIRLADATASVAGRITDLAHLTGVDLSVHGTGPDIGRITDVFGLPSLGGGDFTLRADLEPDAAGIRIDADAGLGEVDARVEGTLDSLTRPSVLDVDVAASGPDLAAAAAIAGLDGLPDDAFEVSGGVRWAGFPITFDAVDIRVGPNVLRVDGTLGAPPTLSGSEIELSGGGPDVSALTALGGVRFPAMPYRVDARLSRVDRGAVVERFDVELGANRVTVSGRIGEWPELEGTDLDVTASGPGLAAFRSLAGLDLPDEAYTLAARISPTPRGLRIDDGTARVGTTSASIRGEVATDGAFVGSRVELDIHGDDLTRLQWAHGIDGLPAESFEVAGTVGLERRALRVEGLAGRAGDVEIEGSGRVALTEGSVGTDVAFAVSGPDASWPLAVAGVADFPARQFEVSGTVRVTSLGLELDGVAARLGDVTSRASGLVALVDGLAGTRLEVDASGDRLDDLEAIIGVTGLPAAPFSVVGNVGLDATACRLGNVVATVDTHHLQVDGVIVPSADLAGTDLELDLRGPELAGIGRLAAGLIELPELPAEPYSVVASVAIDENGYDIRSLIGTLSEARATVAGRLGTPPEMAGSDLTVHVRGPNASLVTAVSGVSVPVAPFDVDGRVERTESGARFHDVSIRLGEYLVELDGDLGEPPRMVGSDLRVHAEGPGLSLLQQLARRPDPLPELPFSVDGHIIGSPLEFAVRDLDLRFGDSDVRGYAQLDLRDRPALLVQLESEVLDLPQLVPARDHVHERADAQPHETEAPPRSTRLLSDDAISFERLQSIDADVDWQVATLRMALSVVTDIDLKLYLEDGRLELGPFDATGTRGGRLRGDVVLDPVAEGYALRTSLRLDNVRADLTAGRSTNPERFSDLDAVIDLGAHGRTPHELAANLDGQMVVSLSGGRVNSSIADLVAADILLQILDTLNPFRGEDVGNVGLECAVLVFGAESGVLVLEPMAVKTDNMTVLGHGVVDFSDESLDFEWVTKPRKGFGISASAITNPYVKLGGSLAKPALEVKPAQAMVSTGVAVATAGLSLLGKGLYDRVTSEGKVCEKALEEAQRRLSGEAPRRRFQLFR